MPRPLKVFGTHIGFHDLIVAAPSMKAAAQAWHASPRIFAQGFARRLDDPAAIQAALAEPGTVLAKPHGEDVPYRVHAALPRPPVLTGRQKKKRSLALKASMARAAAQKRAAAEEKRKEQERASAELAEIAAEETRLRQRRRALRKVLRPAAS